MKLVWRDPGGEGSLASLLLWRSVLTRIYSPSTLLAMTGKEGIKDPAQDMPEPLSLRI
jgi:hypothetical protein